MIRIRVGENWKQNPEYVGALRALAEGRSRGFSPKDIVDVLGIEVDGVDLAQGLAEAALLDAMAELVRAVRSLSSARTGARKVHLARAPVELRLEREGDDLRLSLLSLGAESAIARDVTVEAAPFFDAVRRATRGLVDDLVGIHPALAEVRVVRDLSRELDQRPRKRVPTSRASGPELSASAPMGPLVLAVRADRPSLCVLDEGRACWTAIGRPARALAELGRAVAGGEGPAHAPPRQVSVDARLATVSFGRGAPVPSSAVRRAVLSLAPAVRAAASEADRRLLDAACVLLVDDRPPTKEGASIVAMRAKRPRPVQAPNLPATGLRRVILRPAWRVDAPGPRPRLSRCGPNLLVRTSHHAEMRAVDGGLLWSAGVTDAIAVPAPGGERVVARDGHGALLVLDAQSGTRLARAPAAFHAHLRGAFALGDGLFAAHDGTRVTAVDPASAGRCWSFDPGHERTIVGAAAGSGLVIGTDRGETYGLSADGRVAWRTLSGLDLIEWVRADLARGIAVACGLDPEGRVGVAGVSLATGDLCWRTSLEGVRPSEPSLVRGRAVVGFESASGPTLAAVDVATGRVRWRALPPDDGSPAAIAAGDRLFVARCGGGLAAYEPNGRLAFHQPARDPDAALSPVRPRPPVVGAGLAVVASALVHVFEAESGRPVASFEPAELAPDAIALLDGPVVVAASRDGLVEAWRAAGHLAVVPNLG